MPREENGTLACDELLGSMTQIELDTNVKYSILKIPSSVVRCGPGRERLGRLRRES
jgi:hypothetical protein